MEKYIDVMKQSVELSGTMIEGIEHIQMLLEEGKYEDSMYLFENVVAGFLSIEHSVTPIIETLENNGIEARSKQIKESLELVVSAYEVRNYDKAQEVIRNTLTSHCKEFRQELEAVFSPFLVS